MTVPSVDVALLDRLRAALQRTRRFAEETLDGPRWEPAPGSPAAAEIADAITRYGVDDQIRTTYAMANVLMTGVRDQLGGLEYLLRAPVPVLGPTAVARSAIEISSVAWWLMDPGISGTQRLSRDLVLSLTSAREAGKVAKLLFAPGPDLTDALDQETRVLKRITDAGLQASGRKDKPTVGTEKAESATAQTAEMLHAGLNTPTPPTDIYKTYSASTHGTVYGLMNFLVPLPEPDGSIRLHWGPRADVLDSTIQIAIVAFQQAWNRVNELMGWDNAKIAQEWIDDLEAIFNP